MDNKIKDFDDFFKEVKKETIKMKLFDKVYELPSDVPATIMLELIRANDMNEELDEKKLMGVAIDMLGKENVTEWCDKGITMSQITEIMKWASLERNGKGEDDVKKKSIS